MNKKQIKNILEQTKILFLENDHYLLTVEANERSLTHKFAEHLQTVIGCSWNVDCEYNRYGPEIKVIDGIKEIVGCDTPTDDIKAKTVFPDIIIHKRGADGPNLVVIEAKKDANDEHRIKDVQKLQKIQTKYNYCFAVFIDFKTETKGIEVVFLDNKNYELRCKNN